jgi:hypothetical protein
LSFATLVAWQIPFATSISANANSPTVYGDWGDDREGELHEDLSRRGGLDIPDAEILDPWLQELVEETAPTLADRLGLDTPVDLIELYEEPHEGSRCIGLVQGEYEYDVSVLWSTGFPLGHGHFRDNVEAALGDLVTGISVSTFGLEGFELIGLQIHWRAEIPVDEFPRVTNHHFVPLVFGEDLRSGTNLSFGGNDVPSPIAIAMDNPDMGEWDETRFPDPFMVICSQGVLGVVDPTDPRVGVAWRKFQEEMGDCWDSLKWRLAAVGLGFVLVCGISLAFPPVSVKGCLTAFVGASNGVGAILAAYAQCQERALRNWRNSMWSIGGCPGW